MISITSRDSDRFDIFDSDRNIGYISVRHNPYHAQNYYLDLELTQYDPAKAGELFQMLRMKLLRPFQVMLYSWDVKKCAFLAAGGFIRKRQCYEMEAGAADLKAPVKAAAPIMEIHRGDSDYRICCDLLYHSYIKNHERISPLTADMELFCLDLPETVWLQKGNCEILHYAFIEENEIAYVGTVRQSGFHDFAQTLLFRMLAQHNSIFFECDDCDPAAMELRSFFSVPHTDSYDTYILD